MSVGCDEPAVAGPLVGLSEGLAETLLRRGYAPRTVLDQRKLLGDLSVWLQARGRAAGDLTSGQVDRFFSDRRCAGITRHRTPKALEPILDYLRGLNVLPAFEAAVADGPANAILERYLRFLQVERSLAAATGERYVGCLRPFLDGRISPMVLVWSLGT